MNKRVFLVVLDSVGIGAMPDAHLYGDENPNTLKSAYTENVSKYKNFAKLGLFNIDGVDYAEKVENPIASYGRLACASKGKDTTIGHWEIAGIISEKPLPTYPNGFPKEVLKEFSRRTGRDVICNKPYSGTQVIEEFGDEHVKTGRLIVYTSADSVFQIAAHEDIVPLEELYNCCKIAREILTGDHAVGRVIARPFIGESGSYTRTSNRHDYSLQPPKETMLDRLEKKGAQSIGVGKIYDIFAGRGITETISTKGNTDGLNKLFSYLDKDFNGLCFVNLVDFDMLYGHRNNARGYAEALDEVDQNIDKMISKLNEQDIIIFTADHGCDPKHKGTDHSREYVPVLIYSKSMQAENLGTKDSFTFISDFIDKQF